MGSCHKVKKIHMTKIQPLFMIKTLRELGTERKAPNQTKSISRKATAKIILSGKRLRAMPPQMSPPKMGRVFKQRGHQKSYTDGKSAQEKGCNFIRHSENVHVSHKILLCL